MWKDANPAAVAAATPARSSLASQPPGLADRRARGWRQRLHRWWRSRWQPTHTLTLTQRNVFILPTPAGWMYALTLAVLLVASINYRLNLGFLLTFLLAGSGIVGMHITHRTLCGLTLRMRPVDPVFAGDPAWLDVELTHADGRAHHGIALAALPERAWAWVDVPARDRALLRISFRPAQRGWRALPMLRVETRFPLGIFHAWALWRPAHQVLVYPRPETPARPLPGPAPHLGAQGAQAARGGGEVEGVRAYRRGDPLRLIVWKKAARTSELVSRDTALPHAQELWLDFDACAPLPAEHRLSRLCAWVLEAHRRDLRYGLRLPGMAIAPAEGEPQRRGCLEALALWQGRQGQP